MNSLNEVFESENQKSKILRCHKKCEKLALYCKTEKYENLRCSLSPVAYN